MGEKYYLCDGRFCLQVHNGILISLSDASDRERVPYLNEEKGFGNLFLTWEKGGDIRRWQPLGGEGFVSNPPEKCLRRMRYEGTSGNGDLKVTVCWLLKDGALDHRIAVENSGKEPVRLLDFGVRLSCHSRFAWGSNTKQEILGHHFVAGHGSHSTFYRCDGRGKLLAVLPQGNSKWIYYDQEPAAPGEEKSEEKGTVVMYSLNGCIGKEREEAGARLRIPAESVTLKPGEQYCYEEKLFLAENYEDCREQLVRYGQPVAESVPGYTVPKKQPVLLALRSGAAGLSVESEDAEIAELGPNGKYRLYRMEFQRLGECRVRICFDGKYTELYYFTTEGIRTMMEKRAAFITGRQIRDDSKWYNGLFAEYNNETGAVLSPDNYDKIKGWRIYEVTCDDPGLSKPAFLSSFQTVEPRQDQVDALDYYIEHFVWGGLQQTEEEPFPFGIYGIPDWHALRNSEKEGIEGRMHLWRIYDYPHIALLYYNMYEVASFAEHITTKLDRLTYLRRSYGTARAMFTVPEELEGWSAYQTGLYNELVIEKIIAALKREGMDAQARILEAHWNRKAWHFAGKRTDIFESEYAFDTTGFESTHVLAARGLALARLSGEGRRFGEEIALDNAVEFMENQTACNIACRGLLEPAYFWYGSDYRGDNLHYTLSYMTQMGGCSLLDYACYYAREPFEILRLAYGSLLGSWALLNSGDKESDYGYWFPGKEKDGCACGGFEPLYGGTTWLEQPHKGGAWYYSCEIDLGFCGGLRGASTVVAQDPVFGRICYGGSLWEEDGEIRVRWLDGVGSRFHYIGAEGRIHAECVHGTWEKESGIAFLADGSRICLKAEAGPWRKESLSVRVMIEDMGNYRLAGTERIIRDGEWAEISMPEGCMELVLERN